MKKKIKIRELLSKKTINERFLACFLREFEINDINTLINIVNGGKVDKIAVKTFDISYYHNIKVSVHNRDQMISILLMHNFKPIKEFTTDFVTATKLVRAIKINSLYEE